MFNWKNVELLFKIRILVYKLLRKIFVILEYLYKKNSVIF